MLLAYSPYHNVVNGTAYPAVLLTAGGENDTRVDAWHAKKMTARTQEATTSDRPVLLRLESAGHLAGSLDQSIAETTDRHAFLFGQLGLATASSPLHDRFGSQAAISPGNHCSRLFNGACDRRCPCCRPAVRSWRSMFTHPAQNDGQMTVRRS